MSQSINIKANNYDLKGTFPVPFSKSISNRALILKAISGNQIRIQNLSSANDTIELQSALSEMLNPVQAGEGGTSFRFLAAYLAMQPGKWQLECSGSMRYRPVSDLVDGLRNLGADIMYTGKDGFPPLAITGNKLNGGKVKLAADMSSQHISAIMMIGCRMNGGVEIEMDRTVVSNTYINMTAAMMRKAGIGVTVLNNRIRIEEKAPDPVLVAVEPDWSSASFAYLLAALSSKADIFIPGLAFTGLQGDEIIAEIFQHFGVATAIEPGGIRIMKSANTVNHSEIKIDLCATPDLAIPVAIAGAVLGVNTLIEGISHLQFKESDRVEALSTELAKIGANVSFTSGQMKIQPKAGGKNENLIFDPHQDHRMAMGLAPLALHYPGIRIKAPESVGKSFPAYWDNLQKLGFELSVSD